MFHEIASVKFQRDSVVSYSPSSALFPVEKPCGSPKNILWNLAKDVHLTQFSRIRAD